MRGVQSVDRFVEDRRARWSRLATLVAEAHGRVERLSAADVLELGRLYRAATSDLAIARRDFPFDAVAERLNDLVAAAHALVYSESPTSTRRLRRFAFTEVPATVRATWPFTLAAFLLLTVPLLVAFAAGLLAPEIALSSMSEETREHLLQRRPGSEIPAEMRPIAGPLIIVNNVRVAVTAFAGGMTAGVLTAIVLAFNGAVLGTTFAVLQGSEGGAALLTFVLSHGFLELSAVFLAGGAGLRVGWAMLRPGERSRRDALRIAGAQAIRIVLLVTFVLGVAGLIEAFVSPTLLPLSVKLAIGTSTGALLWAYVVLGGRKRSVG